MSKLTENPEKVVPVRALIIACALTPMIVVLSLFLVFNLILALLFFWLATLANLIAFRLIVVGVGRMTQKKESGKKATMMPNLMMRYALYAAILIGAWLVGGLISLAVAFIGVQMSQIAIKLDAFVG